MYYLLYVLLWVTELLMDFQDESFLNSLASFCTTFHSNCGRGESLGTTTCLQTVVGGRQWQACCWTLDPTKPLFLCPSNFMEITKLSQS